MELPYAERSISLDTTHEIQQIGQEEQTPQTLQQTSSPGTVDNPIDSVKIDSTTKKQQQKDQEIQSLIKKAIGHEVVRFTWNHVSIEALSWILITAVAIFVSVISFAHDVIIRYMFIGRNTMLAEMDNNGAALGWQVLCFVAYNLLFILAMVLPIVYIAPWAEGSGVAAVKAYLNNSDNIPKDFLSWRTLIVKILVAPFSFGVNFFLGKVGAMVHIASNTAACFLSLKPFAKLNASRDMQMYIVQLGCALGIACNFQTPIAGVLFAIEVMSYFNNKMYIKLFYATILGTLVNKLLYSALNVTPTLGNLWKFNTIQTYGSLEIPFFIFFGLLIGIIAPIYSFLIETAQAIRTRMDRKKFFFFDIAKQKHFNFLLVLAENRVWYCILIGIITSIVTMPKLIGPYMNLTVTNTIEDMFFQRSLYKSASDTSNPNAAWTSLSQPEAVFYSLIVFVIFRMLLALLSFPSIAPGGMYVPLLVIGAVLGRFYGELLQYMFPNIPRGLSPAGYAIIGAAAFPTATLQAFSCVFIILEIVGLSYYLPSLISSIIAIIVARWFGTSAYDAVARAREWKYLNELRTDWSDQWSVLDFMKKCDKFTLYETMTKENLKLLLTQNPTRFTYPIVLSQGNPIFLGQITRKDALALLEEPKEESKSNVEPKEGTRSELETKEESTNDVEMITIISDDTIQIPIQSAPHAISETSTFINAHKLFSMYNLHELYIVKQGKLIGFLSLNEFIEFNERVKPTLQDLASNTLRTKFFQFA